LFGDICISKELSENRNAARERLELIAYVSGDSAVDKSRAETGVVADSF